MQIFTSVLRIFKFKNLNMLARFYTPTFELVYINTGTDTWVPLLIARNKIALIESDPKNQPKLRKQTEK